MDIRAPRANRGAGFKSQGCYRPDAVSARPMGHLSRRSLSISSRKASAIHSGKRSPAGRSIRYAAACRPQHGSNSTSRVQTAHTIRPSLLATAIVALL